MDVLNKNKAMELGTLPAAALELRKFTSPALDDLWKKTWIRNSMGKNLDNLVHRLEMTAGAMHFKCDRIVVCAEGVIADMIESALPLARTKGKEMIVFRGSYSALELSRLIQRVEGRSLGLIGVALTPESPALCAGFAAMRKLIHDKYPAEERGKRVKVVINESSRYFGVEAEAGDMEVFPVPSDVALSEAANTEAMLLPMLAAGIDAQAYIDGFKDMVASTWWDADGDAYALQSAMLLPGAGFTPAADSSSGAGRVPIAELCILSWQQELRAAASWLAALHRGAGQVATPVGMPAELPAARRVVSLWCQEEDTDVLLPAFPGASADGSMNQMAKEAAEVLFQETEGTKISLESMKPEELGRFMAFGQMSVGILLYVKEHMA